MNPWKENNDRRPTYHSMQARGNLKGLADILNVVESLCVARLDMPANFIEAYREDFELAITEGSGEKYFWEQVKAIREAEGDDAAEEAINIIKERR